MYKRLKCVLPIVFLGIILGGCQMNSEQKSQKNETKTSKHVSHQKMTKKEQLVYLKEHEQEIIDFIKSQNKKIESVQIDWEETQWNEASNGTPQGGGEIVDVYGTFNNIKNSGWNVTFEITNGIPDLNSMMLTNGLGIGGKVFE
ncbi:hypothetical protein [Streptococcus iniae]|uniref:Lipoprotein BUG3 n=4 Tax=Streptococcus iniae TaxID=1346 RepID=A0ABM5QKB8_STRIN|nr:hypothetical protein [Streptococcus iniae]AHY16531.1 hypothetical protein DQ08_08780 [Streptococcus iniae]AHY18395.1 hypothetical protein DW64_08765 [Streptococcus iniae]APD32554.1 hypothetical protein BMF34_08775 [Streptococcus iniae]MCM0723422.1 hypothetical protein [Streptococcus iniae]OAS96934.1 hypothetical protein A7N10_05525 [Streptococcus iniae]